MRWARVTDRQKDLMVVIAHIRTADTEFTVQEIVEKSKDRSVVAKPSSASQVSQMLVHKMTTLAHFVSSLAYAGSLEGTLSSLAEKVVQTTDAVSCA
ncbi:MAG: hypothetical protein AB1758_21825, partial [Candidatus Eremiobacterota bacterium]